MIDHKRRVTVEEFDKLIYDEEYNDLIMEYIGGEMMTICYHTYTSMIGVRISFLLMKHMREGEESCPYLFTGAGGGYVVCGERYVPNVACISIARQGDFDPKDAYCPNPPDFAVEIVCPDDEERYITLKLANYLASGTVVWIVRPEISQVEVYTPGQPVKIYRDDDVIEGGQLLMGFSLPVNELLEKPD